VVRFRSVTVADAEAAATTLEALIQESTVMRK
jgi:hypothetical protein